MLIVTIAHQRSGTKLLSSLFQSTGAIFPCGEVFSPDPGHYVTFRNFIHAHGIDAIFSKGSFQAVHEFIMELSPGTRHVHIDAMFNQVEHACTSWNDYRFPFLFSYLEMIGAFVVLLTRDSEGIFISKKLMGISPATHTLAGEDQDRSILGAVKLSRSEFDDFDAELQSNYSMTRRFFRKHPWFCEMDYAAVAGNNIPERVFELMREKAETLNQRFEWSKFPPLSSPWVKNPKRFEIEWID